MFKKQKELPPDPKTINKKQIYDDLSVSVNDPLYSNAVKDIISSNDGVDSNPKIENLNSKSFQLIDKILKIKEDMAVQKTTLSKELNNLSNFRISLNEMREHIKNDIENV